MSDARIVKPGELVAYFATEGERVQAVVDEYTGPAPSLCPQCRRPFLLLKAGQAMCGPCSRGAEFRVIGTGDHDPGDEDRR